MSTQEMILKLAGAVGVSGQEHSAMQCAEEYLKPLGKIEYTPLGALVCRIKDAGEQAPHLLLTAHMDSIGMIVSYIDDNGFLRVGNVGGLDAATLLAAQVLVHTKDGAIPGVICTLPPHTNPDDSKYPKIEELSIDIGFGGEKAKEKVALGDRITFAANGCALLDGYITAPAIDDRAGCASVILAAQKLAQEPLLCSLTVVLSTMEEVGGQGAKTAVQLLRPSHGIAVDVSFGNAPDAPPAKTRELKKGPMIGISPILDNGMFATLKATAQEIDMPYQVEVMGGNTSTDADSVATAGEGVRTALISIPQKYMHTPIEIVAACDVESAADLIAAYVKKEFGGMQG